MTNKKLGVFVQPEEIDPLEDELEFAESDDEDDRW